MRFPLSLCALTLTVLLSGCTTLYSASDFLGKTSIEITAEYGPFDCTTVSPAADGSYRNCRCGYTIKDATTGLFGTTEEVLFFIHFDSNSVAINCTEGFRPGG